MLDNLVYQSKAGKVWLDGHQVNTTTTDLIRELTAEIHRLQLILEQQNKPNN